jgi:hypothetical protein
VTKFRAIAVAMASALGLTALLVSGTANASTAPAVVVNHSASTAISARPDSGSQGNTWALDTFTRKATLHFVGEVPLSNCGGSTSTGHCYQFTASITDTGIAATIPGQLAPGVGYENGGGHLTLAVAIHAAMAGTAKYNFFSSWKTADRKPPATENDNGTVPTGRHTTGNWPELFFRAGAQFFSAGVTSGNWTYTTVAGADDLCPNVVSRWVDASPDWGSVAQDGNVLAPDTAHC